MFITRRATLEDLDQLVELRIAFLREVEVIGDITKTLELRQSLKNYFEQYMVLEEFIAWIALENDKVIATSGMSFHIKPPLYNNPSGREAYIMNMYTLPRWRKKGIGATLLATLIEEAERRGIKRILLHATDIAKSLYSKFGFVESNMEMILNL